MNRLFEIFYTISKQSYEGYKNDLLGLINEIKEEQNRDGISKEDFKKLNMLLAFAKINLTNYRLRDENLPIGYMREHYATLAVCVSDSVVILQHADNEAMSLRSRLKWIS